MNIVIFPQSKYPLYIFEPRYKILINKCLADKTGFGIISLSKSELSKIGCYVRVTEVINKFSSGEMNIIVTGKYRFLRDELVTHSDGYHTSKIKKYKDKATKLDLNLLAELRDKFSNILDKVDHHIDKSFWGNYEVSKQKSFKLAEKSGLTLEQQVDLLLMRDENKRIKFLIDHFNQFEKILTNRKIAIGNGYLN